MPAMLARLLSCQSLLVALLAAPGARADLGPDERYRLDTHGWRPGCLGEEELRRQIVRSLGRDPFAPAAAKSVSVAIQADDSGLGGEIEILGPAGELIGRRHIPPSRRRCAELTRALALVVTLALDEQSEMVSAPAAASTVSPVEVKAPLAPAPPVHRSPSWSVALEVGAGLGSGPGVAGGGRVGVEARWPLWSLMLEGGGEGQAGADTAGGRVSGFRIAGAFAGCYWPWLFRHQWLGGCGLVVTGEEHAQSSGFTKAHPSDGPALEAGGRLIVQLVRVGRFSFGLEGDLLVPIVRARFTLGSQTLWQEQLLAGELGLRLAVAL